MSPHKLRVLRQKSQQGMGHSCRRAGSKVSIDHLLEAEASRTHPQRRNWKRLVMSSELREQDTTSHRREGS